MWVVYFDSLQRKIINHMAECKDYKLHARVPAFIVLQGTVQTAWRKKTLVVLPCDGWYYNTIMVRNMSSGTTVLYYYRDEQLHSREKGTIWITFIDVGRPDHYGWHHSLGLDPEFCK